MYMYLLTFIMAAGLVEISGTFGATRAGKLASLFFCSLAVVLLCSLAGARDITIGTDTSGYGLFLYNQGLVSPNLADYIQACEKSQWDIGFLYSVGSYIIIRTFKSQFIYFFVVELCVLIPVLLVILNFAKKHCGLILLAYLLVFYIPSLNIMRQSVAMGFVLLGVLSVVRSNYLRGTIQLAIAVMLHTSALIGVVFYVLWHVAFKRETAFSKPTYRRWIQPILLLLFFGVVLGLAGYSMAASHFSSFASSKGLGRILMYATNEDSEIGVAEFIASFLIVCSAFAFRSRIASEESRVVATFCCLLITMSFPFYFLSGYNGEFSRMTSYCRLFIFPLLGLYLDSKSSSSLVGVASLVLFICLKFFYGYVLQGYNQAVPYMSTLLGIG